MKSYVLEATRFALGAALGDAAAADRAAFARAVQELPVLLRTNGLGQTVAYLKVKDQGTRILYTVLNGWLCGDTEYHPFPPGEPVDAIMAGTREQYIRATEAAWMLCEWLKPLAEAYLPKPEPGARR